MRRIILRAVRLAAGLAGFAGSGFAQAAGTGVYGGGSTLAVNLYDRTAQAIATATGFGANALGGGLNTPGPGGNELWYDADGSGAGQLAFLTQTAAVHGANPPGTSVHFAASDAWLSAAQIAYWNTGAAGGTGYGTPGTAGGVAPVRIGGPLIQLPAAATAVVIGYANSGTAAAVTLTDNDLCGIFSGRITDWSGIEARPGATHAPKGLAGRLTVIYRVDDSGTSWLFTRHLARACTAANTAKGVTFTATRYFADIFTPGQTASTRRIAAANLPAGAVFAGHRLHRARLHLDRAERPRPLRQGGGAGRHQHHRQPRQSGQLAVPAHQICKDLQYRQRLSLRPERRRGDQGAGQPERHRRPGHA
jgi:ABC-type phosphate transport system substrate-binding protein